MPFPITDYDLVFPFLIDVDQPNVRFNLARKIQSVDSKGRADAIN